LPHGQMQQLLAAVVEAQHGSSARSAATALWSAAKLGLRLRQQQVRFDLCCVFAQPLNLRRSSNRGGHELVTSGSSHPKWNTLTRKR
jgi:hypothetical protein